MNLLFELPSHTWLLDITSRMAMITDFASHTECVVTWLRTTYAYLCVWFTWDCECTIVLCTVLLITKCESVKCGEYGVVYLYYKVCVCFVLHSLYVMWTDIDHKKRSSNVDVMLGQRRRRWPNIKSKLISHRVLCWEAVNEWATVNNKTKSWQSVQTRKGDPMLG